MSSQLRGIICGAERSQEWLLPWWWKGYRKYNAAPVTFFDFGMTEKMQRWCRKRGEVISLCSDWFEVASPPQIPQEVAIKWETLYGKTIWNSRKVWFKKPFALLKSPYQLGIWVDLDCEILGSLEPLLSLNMDSSQLGMVRDYATDHLPRLDSGVRYNSGIIVFHQGASIINEWAEKAVNFNHLFWGDDPLLSALIYQHRSEIMELPEHYNWRLVRGLNFSAVVVHWVGSGGKEYIRRYGGIAPELSQLQGLPGCDVEKLSWDLG